MATGPGRRPDPEMVDAADALAAQIDATDLALVRVSFTAAGAAESACGTVQWGAAGALTLRINDGPLTRDQTISLPAISRVEPVPSC